MFCNMKTSHFAFLAAALGMAGTAMVQAQEITVPNGLFALPTTTLALPYVTSWETVPPPEYEEVGVFTNDPSYGPSEYLINCVGGQAAFLYAAPGTALFQDYASVDWMGDSNTFSATFDVGKSYQLITGFTGGAVEPLTPGVVLQMSLYYRDNSGNMITVGATSVVYDPNVFTPTNFVNCELDIPRVQNSDAWAGQHIGIQFLSLATADNQGGTWDLNNVRLFATPSFINPSWSNGQFGASLKSQPGSVFQILATTNLSVPLTNWTCVATLTNVSGTTSFVDPATNYNARFYQARQLPSP
jgi:hypothetical protein